MLRIDPANPVPLWKQIQDGVLRLIASGALRPGDPVDSVRDAARSLGVNPLTVSKAYRGLADQGVLAVRRGEGTFVADAPPPLDPSAQQSELRAAARTYIGRARSLGVERAQAVEVVDTVWRDTVWRDTVWRDTVRRETDPETRTETRTEKGPAS